MFCFFSHGYQDYEQAKPVYKQVKVAPKKPIKPSPSRHYFDSRLEELRAHGKSKKGIYMMSHDINDEYQMMPDEHKLKWILMALEKTPAYLVLYNSV